jgi:hypothetical protein
MTAFYKLSVVALTAAAAFSFAAVGSADAQEYFNGYPCTEDCSGHQAGYDWAEQNGIEDSSDCGGNSQSFIEGCESYAEENNADSDDADAEEDESDSGDPDY